MKETKHNYAKQDEMTLLNRLEKYSNNYLLFLQNFEVSFDDNISEGDRFSAILMSSHRRVLFQVELLYRKVN